MRQNIVLMSEKKKKKKKILFLYHPFFASILSEMGVGNINRRVSQGFVRTTMKYIAKSSNYPFQITPCARVILKLTLHNVSYFRMISDKSPRNNSMKPFQLYLLVLSPLPAF